MTVFSETRQSVALFSQKSMPLWVGAAVYGLLLLVGPQLLNDPDTYSHIALGRWILAHGRCRSWTCCPTPRPDAVGRSSGCMQLAYVAAHTAGAGQAS